MEGHLVGSDDTTIRGQAKYRWLPGGFFLEQHVSMDFMGLEIDSQELIGYDPESGTFPSTVYSNLSPAPLPYRWEVDDDTLRISVTYGPWTRRSPAASTVTARASVGAGVPTGADETVNVPYDIGARRLS